MLLAIDVGNTNMVFALHDGERVVAEWRCRTERQRTADEYFVWLEQLMDHAGIRAEVGSVVKDGNIEVTIAIAEQAALAGLEVASVDVDFVSERRDDVLSVPIAALLARPTGGFAVELVEDGGTRLVPVETGLFAAGRVEVSGEAIAAGARVSVPG